MEQGAVGASSKFSLQGFKWCLYPLKGARTARLPAFRLRPDKESRAFVLFFRPASPSCPCKDRWWREALLQGKPRNSLTLLPLVKALLSHPDHTPKSGPETT
ncbi:MAG: hypothetical protein OXT65_05535 [Alphaproteobacteria bacterium]|nr:hypothetical protein [Alphaproteobacteria bacterium]